jgi:hypothetical protein
VQPAWDEPTPEVPPGAARKPAVKNQFSCDDPTAE